MAENVSMDREVYVYHQTITLAVVTFAKQRNGKFRTSHAYVSLLKSIAINVTRNDTRLRLLWRLTTSVLREHRNEAKLSFKTLFKSCLGRIVLLHSLKVGITGWHSRACINISLAWQLVRHKCRHSNVLLWYPLSTPEVTLQDTLTAKLKSIHHTDIIYSVSPENLQK